MKTVITSSGDNLQSLFDMRFGRAAFFCVTSPECETIEFVENSNNEDGSGAGIKVAERLIELGVKRVVSGDFGPKAKELLDKFNVQMVILQNAGATVEDIIEKMKN